MTQHYDVAVVGGQVSGVIAAALLSKRGRRVLLLDHGENTTHYRRKGLRLPLVPTLVPFLDGSPPVQKVHEELGLGPDLRTASEPLDPVFQAVMPRHRIDIRSDRDALMAELHLEFPELVAPVSRFFDRLFALDEEISSFLETSPPLPPTGFGQQVRTRGILSKVSHLDAPFESHDLMAGIPLDHPFREVLLGPLAFFGHLEPESPSTLHAVRLIARFYRGAVGFSDRIGGLQALLSKAAEQAGVDLHRGAIVKSVGMRGKRLTTLEVDGASQNFTADYFVDNTLTPFQDLLPPSKLQARYTLEQQAARPSGSLLVMNMVVGKDVIPCGMAQALFLLNGRRRKREDGETDAPLLLRRYPAQRGEPGPVHGTESINDAEHEVLSIACPVNTSEAAHSPELLAALKLQIHARIARVIPFLRNYLVDTSLPMEPASWDVEGEDVVRRVDPWTLHPIYEPTSRPILGIATRSTRTAYPNLVHCGRDVVPGLGLEGEYLAGLSAADTLARIAGRAWKQKDRRLAGS